MQNKFDKRKKLKLPKKQQIRDKVLALVERLNKMDAREKFYKGSTQNKSFFNKKQLFTIRKRKKISHVHYYCLSKEDSNRLMDS